MHCKPRPAACAVHPMCQHFCIATPVRVIRVANPPSAAFPLQPTSSGFVLPIWLSFSLHRDTFFLAHITLNTGRAARGEGDPGCTVRAGKLGMCPPGAQGGFRRMSGSKPLASEGPLDMGCPARSDKRVVSRGRLNTSCNTWPAKHGLHRTGG